MSEAPLHLCQTVTAHTKEVLRVHFTADGLHMASVSKDMSVIIWDVFPDQEAPLRFLHRLDISADFDLPWTYPRYPQFSPDKQFLMVIGRSLSNNIGHVAIFDIRKLLGLSYKPGPKVRLTQVYVVPPIHSCIKWLDSSTIMLSHVQPISGTHFRQIFTVRKRNTEEKHFLFSTNRRSVAELFMLGQFIPDRFQRGNPDDRLLIYCSPSSVAPHRRIVAFHFIRSEDIARCFEERLAQGEIEADQLEMRQDRDPDLQVDPEGHPIGLKLDGTQTTLTVTLREYLMDTEISNESNLSSDITVRLIDMKSLTLLPHKYQGATAPKFRKIMKYGDSTQDFIATGSGESNGYVWSRKYGCFLGKLSHSENVDVAVFNPAVSDMLVTASDDHTMKVWRSKKKLRDIAWNSRAHRPGSSFFRKENK